MVLDGVMIIISCTCLTVMHPGIGFGDKWTASKFTFRERAATDREAAEEPIREERLAEVSEQDLVAEIK